MLAGGLVQSDCSSFENSLSESIKGLDRLVPSTLGSPVQVALDIVVMGIIHCHWVKKSNKSPAGNRLIFGTCRGLLKCSSRQNPNEQNYKKA